MAIKAINKIGLDEHGQLMLDREIQLLNQLDHPNIVRYYETYDDVYFIYLVMELCTGGELHEIFLSNPKNMTESFVSLQMSKLLKALHHCHAQNIIHRDIKPHNIMFDSSGEVKLIDFGVSKVSHGHESRSIGSPIYMAPEVWDHDYGKECDMWSLGITLYQLLTGEFPFTGKNFPELKAVIHSGRFMYPKNCNLTDDCKDLIQKMLMVDPKERITIPEALEHPWIKNAENGLHEHKEMCT